MTDKSRLARAGLYGILAGILRLAIVLYSFILPPYNDQSFLTLFVQGLVLVLLYLAFSGIGKSLGIEEISLNARVAVIFLVMGVGLSLRVSNWKAEELANMAYALQNFMSMEDGTLPDAEFREMMDFAQIMLLVLLPYWFFSLVAAFPLRWAYQRTAEATEIPQFRTAGNLFLWGIVLTPLLVGLLLVFVYYIFMIVAFSKLRTAAQKA